MDHEIDKVALSAFLDGELPPDELRAVEEHVAACAACERYLRRIKSASEDFREHGREEAPARVLGAPSAARSAARWRRAGLGLALTAALMITAGVVLKRFMPGMFGQIQGMISGAANDLGK